jgi:hypothetical protein
MSHMKNRDSNKARRAERQASALVRKEVAAARRVDQALANLGTMTAKKERAKLLKRFEAEKAAVTTPAKAPVAKQEAPGATQTVAPAQVPTPRKKKAPKAS